MACAVEGKHVHLSLRYACGRHMAREIRDFTRGGIITYAQTSFPIGNLGASHAAVCLSALVFIIIHRFPSICLICEQSFSSTCHKTTKTSELVEAHHNCRNRHSDLFPLSLSSTL